MSISSVTATNLTRRRLLRTALAAGIGAAVPIAAAGQAWAASAAPGPSRLTLPRPTGPHLVGTVPLHLVDTSRPDSVAGPGRHRELMAGVWYPARTDAEDLPRAPWMTEGALRPFLADIGFPLDPALCPLTAGHLGAPVHRAGGRLPVIVYSHGSSSHRGDHTIIVQELASHGYVVVTVDHTYDSFTEFPDGRVVTPAGFLVPKDFAADLRFVLDCVDRLAAGRNPDVDGRPLPQGLHDSLDPQRVGAFGWSKGGTATALTMIADPRVRAGLSLDGPMQTQPTITADLDRPFMMMTAEFTRAAVWEVARFWTHLHGWRLNIQADGAVHRSYGDTATLIPQAGRLLGLTEQQVQAMVGTLDPAQAVRIQQAYPLAFFDLHLRHRGRHLLDKPSAAFPAVRFIP